MIGWRTAYIWAIGDWTVQRYRGTSLFLDVFLVQYISLVFLLQIKGQQTRLITDRMYEIHHQGRSCLHKSSFSNYWRRPALFTLATGNRWKQKSNFKRPQNASITEAFNLMLFYLFRWRPIWSKQNSQQSIFSQVLLVVTESSSSRVANGRPQLSSQIISTNESAFFLPLSVFASMRKLFPNRLRTIRAILIYSLPLYLAACSEIKFYPAFNVRTV